jgi:hypothetical protein
MWWVDMYRTRVYRTRQNHKTGKAQYRVLECWKIQHDSFNKKAFMHAGHLFLNTNKPYRVGNLINPRKALGI